MGKPPNLKGPRKEMLLFLLVALPMLALGMKPPTLPGWAPLKIGTTRAPLIDKWRRVKNAPLGRGPWDREMAGWRRPSPEMQVKAVNIWVNAQLNYKEDRDVWGQSDYWATPREAFFTKNRQGDCEDYAILKRAILHALGWKRERLFLMIVKDLVVRIDHALLGVEYGTSALVMDNRHVRVHDMTEVNDYVPSLTYSVENGEDRVWTYGRDMNVPRRPAAVPNAPREMTALER